jgi:hypothetical protein
MTLRIAGIALVAGLLLVSAAAGETIFKYRQADGQVVYSNQPISGAVLLEKLEYEPPPAHIEAPPDKSRREAEQRISKQLAALAQAWQEVQDARQALARAEERVRLGVEPKDDEVRQMVGGAELAPPAVGGPQGPAPPAVGGPQPPASPAVGGPTGQRHSGGGRSADFHARALTLEADLLAAQARFDAALRRYNALR